MQFRSCVHARMLYTAQIWERRSKHLSEAEQEFWSLLNPTIMSEEEDGEGSATICRKRPRWRSQVLNDLMDNLDRRSKSGWFIEASKEAACFGLSGVTAYTPDGLLPWMVDVH